MVGWLRKCVGRGLGVTLVLGLFLLPSLAWGTTQVGNAELQLWYRMRHTFHTDSGDHFDWVQWRNEAFGWLVYDPLVENGRLFDQIQLPWVKRAVLNARYRFRYDPVYQIRDHFENIFDGDERDSFIIPENGFRDLFVDLDFEQVGPGRLSVRVGNQQIVWGESDLFRSLDIINPLRLDQNTFAGEKFDEFRTPILAIKALYDLGSIGQYLSQVTIEPWYSPRYRSITSDLILGDVLRLPVHIKGCLDENGNLVPFDIKRCSELRASNGQRVFVPYRPTWLGSRRSGHPWAIFNVDDNWKVAGIDAGLCNPGLLCSPDIFGGRNITHVPRIRDKGDEQTLKGAGGKAQGGGVRILAKTFFNLDFSLNYMFLPQGVTGVFDLNRMLLDPRTIPVGGPAFRPEIFYGDPEIAEAVFGLPPGTGSSILAGNFEEGLRRCLTDGGKSSGFNSKDRGHRAPTFLIGADLRGYNHPDRFRSNNPNGALDDNGNAIAPEHNAARPPLTFCSSAIQEHWWTHVVGLTATYNDFEYTGAIIRLEQSWSSKEIMRHLAGGFGRRFREPFTANSYRSNGDEYTRVWRSMLGFDLVRGLGFFRYIPGIHHSFYDQLWFLSGQWLVENYWDNIANNICQVNDNVGFGFTGEQVQDFNQDRAAQGLPGRASVNVACRRYRWNHLFTFVVATNGLFAGRGETRNAIAYEPRSKQYLLYTQNWWREVMGFKNLELSMGVVWFPSSRIDESFTALNHYAHRDQLWFELTYYLL